MKFCIVNGTELVFCFKCNAPRRLRQDLYIEDNALKCLECNNIVGYAYDLEAKEFFEGVLKCEL